MKEVIAEGKDLDAIRIEWSEKWACPADQLQFEILEKPGVFKKNWKVKVWFEGSTAEEVINTNVIWDGEKYIIYPGSEVTSIIPYPSAGKLMFQNEEVTEEFKIEEQESLEFYPVSKKDELSWDLEIKPDKSKAVAKVKHQHAGRYVFVPEIPNSTVLSLEKCLRWECGERKDDHVPIEEQFKKDLLNKGIIYGVKNNAWIDIITVDGLGEITIAEWTPPTPPVQPQLKDYVGEPIFGNEEEAKDDKIDYFACKIKLCKKDEVLAVKIPGQEGQPGIDVLGAQIPVEKLKDFHFKSKDNVYLSDDGLEVRAACDGIPLRINEYTYKVDNAYVVSGDVDLESGSIDFPGDVFVAGNVQEGLYVVSTGKIHISGSVTGARIKAETGIAVKNNVIASTMSLGDKYVFRSELVQGLKEVNKQLIECFEQIEKLQSISSDKSIKIGQLLKALLEKNYSELPLRAEGLEKLILSQKDEIVNQELEIAVRTMKHFLVGLGPLQLKDLTYLQNASKIISHFLATKGEMIPENVICEANYVQKSEIRCAGDFICYRGVYNSTIKAEGNINITGVCRGGELQCRGNVEIGELGGSCMSATVIKTSGQSHLKIKFCHPNIKIFVGRELVKIDYAVKELEIYRENGILQVEKLKWDVPAT